MSWDGYIDNMKAHGAQKCGIYVLATNQPCGQFGMNLNANEVQALKSVLGQKSGEFSVDGKKCCLINVDEQCVQGKTKEKDADGNKFFFHCEFSKQMIVIAGNTGSDERKACGIAGNIGAHLRAGDL